MRTPAGQATVASRSRSPSASSVHTTRSAVVMPDGAEPGLARDPGEARLAHGERRGRVGVGEGERRPDHGHAAQPGRDPSGPRVDDVGAALVQPGGRHGEVPDAQHARHQVRVVRVPDADPPRLARERAPRPRRGPRPRPPGSSGHRRGAAAQAASSTDQPLTTPVGSGAPSGRWPRASNAPPLRSRTTSASVSIERTSGLASSTASSPAMIRETSLSGLNGEKRRSTSWNHATASSIAAGDTNGPRTSIETTVPITGSTRTWRAGTRRAAAAPATVTSRRRRARPAGTARSRRSCRSRR